MANAEWRLEPKRGMDGVLEAEPQRKSSEAVPRHWLHLDMYISADPLEGTGIGLSYLGLLFTVLFYLVSVLKTLNLSF